jgi:hypothetical protein
MTILLATMLLLPALCCAQNYVFQQEWDSVQVQINGYTLPAAWSGGYQRTNPDACDIDSDGDNDIFIGQSQGGLIYYEDVGNSLTPEFVLIETCWMGIYSYFHSAPRFFDIDLDGDFDFMMDDGMANTFLYKNIGNPIVPQFTLVEDSLKDADGNLIDGTYGDWVDIDADDDLDYFTGTWQSGYIRYYQNNGDGWNYSLWLINPNLLGSGVGDASTIRFCDIDNDGDFDLFIGDYSGHIRYWRNDGTAQQAIFVPVSNQWLSIDVGDYAAPEFADMDGDGDYDLWVGRDAYNTNDPGDVFYYQNNGTSQSPQFQFVRANNFTLDAGPGCGPVLVDSDQDGDADLWYTNGTYLTLFNNVGSSINPNYRLFDEDLLNGTPPYAIALYDLDADGDQDLISAYGTYAYYGLIKFYENNGTPQNPNFTFTYQIENSYLMLGQVTLADMDADGDGDILVGRYSGNLVYYENQGNPQHPNFVLQTENWQNIGCWTPQLADMDLDSDFDLLARNPVTGRVWLYENIGTPQSVQMVLADTNLYGLTLLAGAPCADDIDSDGDVDLLNGFFDGGIHFLRNITGESPVHPDPKRPAPTHPVITLLPNPGNSTIAASYKLQAASQVSLKVFDITGRLTGTLFYGFQLPGTYSYTWDAREKASGVYILQLDTPNQKATQKITILK